ncbi:MAG: bifunctional adenosylcobinamide kinase/adenosylcobinamide-phosphate guanylyltransferase [Myxococcales bacterium]|nr:bifunctional adenosylcobinamide kinase/adenosylcobinamide-phosphate guanylyltransferase [Myxococcales bacterium]
MYKEQYGGFALIGGGVRSGKSKLALRLASKLGTKRAFLATAQALDREMTNRIALHQQERGNSFDTHEEPLDVASKLKTLGNQYDVVLVDCLTLWLSNLLSADNGFTDGEIKEKLTTFVTVSLETPAQVVVVSNEVGCGIVPINSLSRRFVDLTGFAHQQISSVADEIYLCILGTSLRIRPEPIEVFNPEIRK